MITWGYGLPPEGSLVTGGMGLAEPVAPGALFATLAGTSSLTALLTSTATEPVRSGRGQVPTDWYRPLSTPAYMTAQLSGSAHLASDLDFTLAPDTWQQLEALLILNLV